MTAKETEIDGLYRAYAPMLFRVCLRYVRDPADAEDLVHAAFGRVLAAPGSFRGESGVLTWMYRIAVNEALQFLRREKGRPKGSVMLDEELDCAAPEEGDVHLRLTMRQLLDRFPADVQELAVLHYLEGMSQEEASAATGVPLRTVEQKLSRFRAQARKWFEKMDKEEARHERKRS